MRLYVINLIYRGFEMSQIVACFPLYMVRRACKYNGAVTSKAATVAHTCITHMAKLEGGRVVTIHAPSGKVFNNN